jgi:hypothetical protein
LFGFKIIGTVCKWFGIKTTGTVSPYLGSKPVVTVSQFGAQNRWCKVFQFGAQNRQLRFGGLGLKITLTVSWFSLQSQEGYGWSIAPQNRWEDEDIVGDALRSSLPQNRWKQVRLGFSNLPQN